MKFLIPVTLAFLGVAAAQPGYGGYYGYGSYGGYGHGGYGGYGHYGKRSAEAEPGYGGYAGNIYHPSAITAGAPAALAAAPATVVNAYDAHAHAHVAGAYALPAARTIHEAPIVEQTVEPVEQWGYKVAY